MNFTKASDEQLLVLIGHEKNIPKELMAEIVEESCNRKLFNYLIQHVLVKSMKMKPTQDLYQIGYIGIMQALKYYKQGDYVFKSIAYSNVKQEIIREIEKNNALKRKSEVGKYYLDKKVNDDNEETYLDQLIDHHPNVETQVINKMFLEESFSKLSKREAEVLYYFGQGYSLNEIANNILGITSAVVHGYIHRAFKKINPNRPKVNMKQIGLGK